MHPCLYTLAPAPNADPGVPQRLPVTVRCERALGVGIQIWVQHECWELVARDAAPERAAFLCATSPLPRARILAAARESWLYEPDLLDLAGAVRRVHADETPATRTIQAAIRAALHGGAEVEATSKETLCACSRRRSAGSRSAKTSRPRSRNWDET
jgi:hypothetical protein